MNTLTVAILSYNRPQQLLRCISSMLPLPPGVRIEIFDDCSPKFDEIRSQLNTLLNRNLPIFLNKNEVNIGYDKNLLNAILKSQTDHVLLMSDDDFVEPSCLWNLQSYLKENNPKTGFLRYKFHPECFINKYGSMVYDRNFKENILFDKNEVVTNGNYIYHSILFSGLIFNRQVVEEISDDLSDYFGSIYIQVAIFALVSMIYGGCFICGPGIIVGGDGDNGFGTNSASIGEVDLIDRSNVQSNLKFHRRLIRLIDRLSETLGDDFKNSFRREYCLRSNSGLRESRRNGRKQLIQYWTELRSLQIDLPLYNRVLLIIFYVLPMPLIDQISRYAEHRIRRIRYQRKVNKLSA